MPLSVLIVDDEDDIRFLVRVLLTSAGWDVVDAASGEQALEILDSTAVDLVVLDIRLPGIDGWETLKELQSARGDAMPKVIMFSAHVDDDAVQRAADAGCVGYLTKPFRVEDLYRMVPRGDPR